MWSAQRPTSRRSNGIKDFDVAELAALEPAPVTPTGHTPVYALVSGTIMAAFESSVEYKNRTAVVQPSFALGTSRLV